jgi:glycosyltransferase involved in cell wall biosynthesis
MLTQITPVILTFNEAPNIRRTLNALRWATRVVVLDSYSTDETEALCNTFSNVDFRQRGFDQHAHQWNAAIALDIDTPWILALDADYVLSDALIDELRQLEPTAETAGFWVSFIYKIKGKSLSGSLYPPVVALFRTGAGRYQQDGHTQRLSIEGRLHNLTAKIYHDDRKSWRRWLSSQRRYARQEANKLATTTFSELSGPDRLRYLGIAPLIIMPYTLLIKKTLLNGWPGLQYAWQRFIAELCLQAARLPGRAQKS